MVGQFEKEIFHIITSFAVPADCWDVVVMLSIVFGDLIETKYENNVKGFFLMGNTCNTHDIQKNLNSALPEDGSVCINSMSAMDGK